MYLTGNPQITFWQVVYRRHTNFAMESMEQTFTGTADFGRKASCLVARNGDLIHKAYLEIDLPAMSQTSGTVCWTRNIGHVLIDEISFEIGGSTIDKHYGIWLTIWNELTQTAEKEDGYNVMIGNTHTLTTPAASIPAATVYVPLIFSFNRNPGLALPLIALMYHEVKINITFNAAANCYITDDNLAPTSGTPSITNCTLYIDYIFLDAEERRMFSQSNHEYLIEQLQFTGAESFSNSSVRQKLNFSHPCKELVWVVQLQSNTASGANRWVDFTDNGTGANPYAGNDPLVDAKIQLNTHDRLTTRAAAYYNLIQPYNHHTRIPATGIYVYSFALNPEQHQPSGSINMSRIESTTLNMNLGTGTAPVLSYVFAVNYNVFKSPVKGENKTGKAFCHPVCRQHRWKNQLQSCRTKICTTQMLVSMNNNTCDIAKLRETPKARKYQTVNESPQWPREKYWGTVITFRDKTTKSSKWTIRSQRSKSTSRIRSRFNDYMVMALRDLTNLNDGLRDSLCPCQIQLTDKYTEKVGYYQTCYSGNGWL